MSGFWRPSRSPRPSHLWPRNETDQWDVSPQAANYSALLFTASTKSTPHWIRSCFLTRKAAAKPWSTDAVCQPEQQSVFWCSDFERQNTSPHRSHLWPRNETDQWDVSPQAANYSALLFTAPTKSTPHWIRSCFLTRKAAAKPWSTDAVCQPEQQSVFWCSDFERQNTSPHRSHLWPRNETDQWDVSPQAANYSAPLFTASTKSTPHWIREAAFSHAKQQLRHEARMQCVKLSNTLSF